MPAKPFSLHVDCSLNYPLQKDGSITYGPLRVMKLEAHKVLVQDTGVKLVDCNVNGKLVIVPHESYADVLKFEDNEYASGDTESLTVKVSNLTTDFIRIEATDYLFTFTYVENEKKPKKEAKKKVSKKESKAKPAKEEVVEEVVVAEEEVAEEEAPVEEEVAEEETKEEDAAGYEVVSEEVVEDAAPVEEEPKKEVSKPRRRAKQKISV